MALVPLIALRRLNRPNYAVMNSRPSVGVFFLPLVSLLSLFCFLLSVTRRAVDFHVLAFHKFVDREYLLAIREYRCSRPKPNDAGPLRIMDFSQTP